MQDELKLLKQERDHLQWSIEQDENRLETIEERIHEIEKSDFDISTLFKPVKILVASLKK